MSKWKSGDYAFGNVLGSSTLTNGQRNVSDVDCLINCMQLDDCKFVTLSCIDGCDQKGGAKVYNQCWLRGGDPIFDSSGEFCYGCKSAHKDCACGK